MNRSLGVIVLLFAVVVHGQESQPVDTEQQIADGISYFDTGDFDSAVALFEQILEREPRNGLAAYELALTHQASGDLSACVDVARKYLRNLRKDEEQAGILPQLSVLEGSCHSQAGDTKKALKAFRDGLKKSPDDYALNFNISITLINSGDMATAISHLERAIAASPDYPSPYYVIGAAYQESGLRVRSQLAFLTFLQREFNTTRCVPAAQAVVDQIYSQVSAEDDASVIFFSPSSSGGEPDEALSTMELTLSLLAVAGMENGEIKEPVVDTFADAIQGFVNVGVEITSDVDPESFVGMYLLPDIRALKSEEVTIPFSYFVLDVAGIDGAADWLEDNAGETDRLVEYFQMARESESR